MHFRRLAVCCRAASFRLTADVVLLRGHRHRQRVRGAITVLFWPLVGAGVVHVAGGELGSALGFCRTAVALCRVVLRQNPR